MATLQQAAKLLSDSPDARLLVSHISGASFVRRELGDNPATVRNTMPFLEMMQARAFRHHSLTFPDLTMGKPFFAYHG